MIKNKSIKPLYDKHNLLIELVPAVFLAMMIIIAIIVYPIIPDRVPIHWNAAGQADNFGSKNTALFLIPGIYLVLLILLLALPAMDVYRENIKKFYKYYIYFKILFGAFFLALYIATLMPNFGYIINVSKIVMILLGFVFIYLGSIMKHFKRNFFIGIRTAWTLSDDEVWEETHKKGGIAFLLLGTFMIIGSLFLNGEVLFTAFIILILIISLGIMLYSYILYRRKYFHK
jgi:uncharacterized membrane protein